jgi:hypothetical protein
VSALRKVNVCLKCVGEFVSRAVASPVLRLDDCGLPSVDDEINRRKSLCGK